MSSNKVIPLSEVDESGVNNNTTTTTNGGTHDGTHAALKKGATGGASFLFDKKKTPVYLNWLNIEYAVDFKVGGKYPWSKSTSFHKEILKGISGFCLPGEFCAVMGPSGSGKTSLLNVLASLTTRERYTGDVLINGMPVTKDARRLLGFVQQFDVVLKNLTVEESLTFTAMLRLKKGTNYAAVVNDVIAELGLDKCRHSKIGDGLTVIGCSGGERKRVSIATELITNPSLLLLDEPTSGLDSSIALALVQTLIKLAKGGRTVVCTIHQPSSQIFENFSRLILLANGKCIYSDLAANMVSYFSELGHPCPTRYNPADFILDLANDDDVAAQLALAYDERQAAKRATGDDVNATKAELHRAYSHHRPEKFQYAVSWAAATAILSRRTLKTHFFDVITRQNFFQYFFIGIAAILAWLNTQRKEENLNEKLSGIFFILTLLSFMSAAPVIMAFPQEMLLMKRERFSGTYRVSSYYVAKLFSQVWVNLIFPLMLATMVYWSSGLRRTIQHYLVFVCFIVVTSITGQSFGIAVITRITNVSNAMAFAITFMLGLLLFSGFFVDADNIPNGLEWIQYLSYMRYTYIGLLKNEFHGIKFKCSSPSEYTQCPVPGAVILDDMGIPENESIGTSMAVLIAMLVFFYALGYYHLRFLKRNK